MVYRQLNQQWPKNINTNNDLITTCVMITRGQHDITNADMRTPTALENCSVLYIPWSGACQDGSVEQAEGEGPGAAHREDDGMEGDQHIALGVVGQQGLGQLTQGRQVLHCRSTAWRDEGGGLCYY